MKSLGHLVSNVLTIVDKSKIHFPPTPWQKLRVYKKTDSRAVSYCKFVSLHSRKNNKKIFFNSVRKPVETVRFFYCHHQNIVLKIRRILHFI